MTTTSPNSLKGSDVRADQAIYLDCNATTPPEPAVMVEVQHYLTEEYGNAGSRTHEFGQRAKERVSQARRQVAAVVGAQPEDVVFTSGATESNNLAILGLAAYGDTAGRRHLVSTQIEHKAVLEPLQELAHRGFEITLVPPTPGGWVDPDAIRAQVRPDTLLVSVMHVNNETGVIQPISEIVAALDRSEAYFHVDAAQGFGKELEALRSQRIDLISVSGHKVYGPKGIGALIARRRGYARPPLQPLMHGGGQERGLRPGTLPVALVAGLGLSADLALRDHQARLDTWMAQRKGALSALRAIGAEVNGDLGRTLATTLNISLQGVDSEAAMLALKGLVAISNGSACTSQTYEPSHVLTAMQLDDGRVRGALRWSWSHLTPPVDWEAVQSHLKQLL